MSQQVEFVDPATAPEAYEFAIIAGIITPGVVADVSGASRPFKWDTKEAKGKSGGSPTGQGAELQKPSIKLYLWQDTATGINHFERWFSELKPRLDQAANASPPEALSIYYPTLADNGIGSVSIAEIGALTPEGSGGLWSVTIDFIEVVEPKDSGGTPSGVKGGGGGHWSQEDYDQELADEQAKLQAAIEAEEEKLIDQMFEEQEQKQHQYDEFWGDWNEDDGEEYWSP